MSRSEERREVRRAFPAAPDGAGEITVQRVSVRVGVADPHVPVREGLPPLLAREGVDVVAVAAGGAAAEAVIASHGPDVALVAADLGDMDGLALLRRLAARNVRSAVVLYADRDDPHLTAAALHGGAAGIVPKRAPITELAAALRAVAAGRLWFEEASEPALRPRALVPLLDELRERRTASLSSAELRVLALVADGSSTEEAAELLSLSPHTVRTHLRNVMRKLEASSRAHAVAIAIREHVIKV